MALKEKLEIVAVAVAFLSMILSIVVFVYSVNANNRRALDEGRREVRAVSVPALDQINGILSGQIVVEGSMPSQAQAETIQELYFQSRTVFRVHKHCFPKGEVDEVGALVDKFERDAIEKGGLDLSLLLAMQSIVKRVDAAAGKRASLF